MPWKFLCRTADSQVGQLLNFFTFLPRATLTRVMEQHSEAPEKHHAQHVLAEQVVRLVHGAEALDAATGASDFLFERLRKGNIASLFSSDCEAHLVGVPRVRLDASEFRTITSVLDFFVKAGVCSSKSRFIHPHTYGSKFQC